MGRAVYVSLNELRTSGDFIVSARDEIDELRSGIRERRASLDSDETTSEERRTLRAEIDSMDERIDELQDQVVVLAGTLAFAIAEYRNAVEAARSEGFNEPMESELIAQIRRLAQ